MEFIGGWTLPQSYFDEIDEKDSGSMARFAVWLRAGIIFHALTRTLLGGPWGVKWPVLLLCRAFWTYLLLNGGERPDWAEDDVSMRQSEVDIVLELAVWLTNEMHISTRRLHGLQAERLIPYEEVTYPDVEFTRAEMWSPELPEVRKLKEYHDFDKHLTEYQAPSPHESDAPLTKARREVRSEAKSRRAASKGKAKKGTRVSDSPLPPAQPPRTLASAMRTTPAPDTAGPRTRSTSKVRWKRLSHVQLRERLPLALFASETNYTSCYSRVELRRGRVSSYS